ncbi:YegP family protein [Tardiphaga sp.]|uniref:YegP family protein n=1 Tax=Tardiphaga sp. TaxID=1926292 RepID=UPI0026375D72|nr:YegP family protein [Tardiphaga sp.]MDB5619565.1 hypothetical protein [Tardiphaga sp.]
MAGKFVLSKGATDKYHFVLKAGNSETILSSQHYAAKTSAEEGIASVKVNAPHDERYERKNATDGSPMFNLKAANGQVIGTSETYSSAAARDNGIASVKTNAPGAAVEDKTGA